MMRKFYTLLLIGFSVNGFSQVVLTQKDSIKVGTNIAFAVISDTTVLKNFRFSKSGFNNFWDFTNLGVEYYDTAKFCDPKRTIYSSDFTDCNMATGDTAGFYNGFYKTDSSGFYQIGIGGFLFPSQVPQGIRLKHPLPIFKFPAKYPSLITDTNYMRDKYDNHGFGDSAYNEQYIYTSKEIIATGQIQLPFGKFDAFLLKTHYGQYDTTNRKIDDSTWIKEINVWSGTSTNFEWYCNNSTFMVARVSGWYEYPVGFEKIDRMYVQMNNYANLKSLSVSNNEPTQINIYPNPTSDQFYIETNETDKLTVDLYDVNGRHVFNARVSDKESINIETLDNGAYTLVIKTADRIINKKLVILR